MALSGLNILAEQRQLLSCIDGLLSEAQESAGRAQSLKRQVPVHYADLCSVRGDMTFLKDSITVLQRQLADAQFALVTVEGRETSIAVVWLLRRCELIAWRRCLAVFVAA